MAIVFAFVLIAALVLRLVPIHDYVDNVKGAIITNVRPTRLLSEDQYLIADVRAELGEHVKRGDALVQLDGAKQLVQLNKLEHTLSSKRSDLDYNREKDSSIQHKLELNSLIIEKKRRLSRIDAVNTAMVVELDAKRQSASKQLQVLSEDIINRLIPALDNPAISKIEKAGVLADANENLERMYEFSADSQSNRHKAERDQLSLQVDVAEMEVEQANLRLESAEVKREIGVIQGAIDSIEQEIGELRSALGRLLIRSPVDGQVIRISSSLLDSNLVEKNNELFLIQPEGSKLEAELALTDEQFKDARVGQEVNLELYAWNHYRYGTIRGKIVNLSKSKIMPQVYETDVAHFIANVEISPSKALALEAGYTLDATLILEKISLLEFIMKRLQIE